VNRITCIVLGIAATIVLATDAQCQLYVDRAGNDANPCSATLPCKTVQAAVDRAPQGFFGWISIGCGTYPEPINIYYFRTFQLIGADRNCVFLRAMQPQTIAWVQDHATATFQEVTFWCDSSGVGVASRQFAIVDLDEAVYSGCDAQIAASEESKINEGGRISILRGGILHGLAGGLSYLDLPANFSIFSNVQFTYFLEASKSYINADGMTKSGADIMGRQVILINSEIDGIEANVPGQGIDCYNFSVAYGNNCTAVNQGATTGTRAQSSTPQSMRTAILNDARFKAPPYPSSLIAPNGSLPAPPTNGKWRSR